MKNIWLVANAKPFPRISRNTLMLFISGECCVKHRGSDEKYLVSGQLKLFPLEDNYNVTLYHFIF